MKRLTKTESENWLQAAELAVDDDGHHVFPMNRTSYGIDFSQPASARGLSVTARRVIDLLPATGERLLFITETHVWPTEETWNFFNMAMIGYGDSRLMNEAPGFLFDSAESEDLVGLLRFSLVSGWSGMLVAKDGSTGFVFTDDDWLGYFATTSQLAHAWLDPKYVNAFQLRVMWEGAVER